ncbi:MAG: hypothetical protein CL920_30465 [Deltaproteobacteria bacterium]|nr:hypothetical protein [Deltaproteobacteria bacterium]MBU53038.1 hypothetical protein [Deltaproteobacteria bacterium]|tara:strand:- start:5411 stop:5836 length:426 start_codon:yes stop_codon:yes gene_type:complete
MIKRPKIWLTIGLFLTFVLGGLSGVALERIRMKRRFIRALDLPPAQQRARLLAGMLRVYFRLGKAQHKKVLRAALTLIQQQRTAHVRFQRETQPHTRTFYNYVKQQLTPRQRKKWPALLKLLRKYKKPQNTTPQKTIKAPH